MAGWTTLNELVSREFEQAVEEGKPAAEVEAVRAAFERSTKDEAALTAVHAQLLAHYSAIHTNNNLAVIVASLLLSGGDYHRGITTAVMAGFDTDCNGATVGSILGAAAGASKLPAHWTARLNDTLKSGISDYHPVAISECARRSLDIVRQINETSNV